MFVEEICVSNINFFQGFVFFLIVEVFRNLNLLVGVGFLHPSLLVASGLTYKQRA